MRSWVCTVPTTRGLRESLYPEWWDFSPPQDFRRVAVRLSPPTQEGKQKGPPWRDWQAQEKNLLILTREGELFTQWVGSGPVTLLWGLQAMTFIHAHRDSNWLFISPNIKWERTTKDYQTFDDRVLKEKTKQRPKPKPRSKTKKGRGFSESIWGAGINLKHTHTQMVTTEEWLAPQYKRYT